MDIGSDMACERPPNVDERHPVSIGALAIDDSRGDYATQFRLPNRVAILIIAIFWIAQYAAFSAYSVLMIFTSEPTKTNLLPRAIVSGFGFILSFGILVALENLRRWQLPIRALAAIGLAILGSLIHAAINHVAFGVLNGDWQTTYPLWLAYIYEVLDRLWIFVSVSVIALALSYAADIRERENRIHALQALAHSAQMRALRNQLNPHFLFNALNSIAGLISAKSDPEAEAMTENLADFLRLTLALDPQMLITLDEELKLQALYLSIEQVRFPGRLNVKVDVPADLSIALVPSLITQPLIENSIKYAVAQSTQPVDLRIGATKTGDHLEITVSDSGGNAGVPSSKGAKLGLRNVAERVSMHYGEEGRFATEANPAGGFRNVITIPLRFQR